MPANRASGGGRGRGRGSRNNPTTRASGDAADGTMNAHLPERFRGRLRRDLQGSETTPDFGVHVSLNQHIREYIQAHERIAGSTKSNAWLSLPELPTNTEVASLGSEDVKLMANKAGDKNAEKGPWKSTEKYLRTHYELMREDAVSPLRDAVDTFRQNPEMDDDFNVAIYEKVHIAGLTFAHMGVAVRIRFSTTRAGKKIPWASSKRLTSGTIVALTPSKDKFATKCIVAVVAARPLQGVQLTPCEIDIYFAHTEDLEIDPQEEWVMIEAKTGYYEAYRHTLRAMQKLSAESFPLSDHICYLSPDIAPPNYVQEQPILDLSAVASNLQEKDEFRKIDILKDWPASFGDTLDKTQWDAMKHILTKRLSVIQGPPGTGKTHVSKIALQILAENRRSGDAPIIIAAQTNHALDQLLGHISVFDPNYIRLGGRSTNPEVKKRALYEVRQKERIPLIPGGKFGQAMAGQKVVVNKIIEILAPLNRDCFEPFSARTLLRLGIITNNQCESLEKGAAQWVSSEDQPESPIQLWLTDSLIAFTVNYKQDNFGFEEAEEDLEFEQLKEQEAENGVADEEDIELLKGQWCHLEDRFTVQKPSTSVLDKAKKQLDTVQDLWKVAEYLRGPMYSIMQAKAKMAIVVQFREAAREYARVVQDLKVGKWERDAIFLQRVNIVGMTTTGLSKYRPLIASLKPKIILIEEAAEVIESPVTAACVESLEHLILVGDHKQLQGHCSVSELEGEPYYLNVSMFERLVKNDMPYKTLLRQRRMDPEFRQLLMSIYPDLKDHDVVKGRAVLPVGLGNRKSFFFDHEFSEMRDAQLSTFNDKEAEFVAEFYKYLLKNGLSPPDITILTFYNGQRKRILKYLRDDPMTKDCYNNVKTVDSYQGEENTIVLLSLVRSNEEHKIGFLDVQNRVCVALSRAKFGFYIFGNARLLTSVQNELWINVVNTMLEDPGRLGHQFPLVCTKHGRTKLMAYPEDWYGNDGGCDEICGEAMPCGHVCDLKCHPYPHDKLSCLRECQRKLTCGHPCQKQCHEGCFCSCDTFKHQNDDSFRDGDKPSVANPPPQDSFGKGPWGSSKPQLAFNGSTDIRSFDGYDSYNRQHKQRGHVHPTNLKKGQVLVHAPNRGKNNTLEFNGPSYESKLRTGPPTNYYALAGSNSSKTNTLAPSHSCDTFVNSVGQISQHSSDKQSQGVQSWTGFAKGGVKEQDASIARNAALEAAEADEKLREMQPLIDLDFLSISSSPVKNETVEIRNGRKIFTQEYQPTRVAVKTKPQSKYAMFGFGELGIIGPDGASSSRLVESLEIAEKKHASLLEESLLD